MDTFKILIVDDEIKIINALRRVLNRREYELFSAINPYEAIEIIKSSKIDLIICDAYMPDLSGIEVLKFARDFSPQSVRILMTGYSEYSVAVDAINTGGIYHYISKPWSNKGILKVVEEGLQLKRNRQREDDGEDLTYISERLTSIQQMIEPISCREMKIPVYEKDDVILINSSEICYFTSVNGHVVIVTRKGTYKSSESLNNWQTKLKNTSFFRCHRSYLVNINKIEKISPWFNGTCNLKLIDMKESIPVSRNLTKNLKEIIGY